MVDSEQKKIKDTEPGKELDPHIAQWVEMPEEELQGRKKQIVEMTAKVLETSPEFVAQLVNFSPYKLEITGPQAKKRSTAVSNELADQLKMTAAIQKLNTGCGVIATSGTKDGMDTGEVILFYYTRRQDSSSNSAIDVSMQEYLGLLHPSVQNIQKQHELFDLFKVPNYPIQA